MTTAWSRTTKHWSERQHRNAYFLIFNNLLGAATGVVFWLLFARLFDVDPAVVGVGYATIALGTLIGVLAKGGLDTAILRSVPRASREAGLRLLVFAVTVGIGVALLLTLVLAYMAQWLGTFQSLDLEAWLLAALVAALLVTTWLQDAHFLAEGDAGRSFIRNVAFSTARLLLPIPLLAASIPHPIATSWALSLVVSAGVAAILASTILPRRGEPVRRDEFLTTAVRNLSAGAAEFLPGLLLVPLVLAMEGPAAAAYFGIAWTAASLLFLAASAVSRSGLAEMVRAGPAAEPAAIRRAALQNLIVVAPGILILMVFARPFLSVFGADYATEGAATLSLLAASTLVVAPSYLYLGLLRARDRPIPLAVFPAAMVVALAILAPILSDRLGLIGVAAAWLVANAPFGIYATWRLAHHAQEVTPRASPQGLGGPAHLE